MDILSVLKGDNQRHLVSHFLPGMIALWPFVMLAQNGLGFVVDFSNEFQILFLSAIYVLLSVGLGVLLEDIGSLIELRLEDIFFDLKSQDRKVLSKWNKGLNFRSLCISIVRHTTAFITIFFTFKGAREWLLGCHLRAKPTKFNNRADVRNDFYETWHKYLRLSFKEGEEPIALRYYRAILIRFKFEINTCMALLLMLFGHLILKLYVIGPVALYKSLDINASLVYVGGVAVTSSILIVEAFKMIELLDEIRAELVSISEMQK